MADNIDIYYPEESLREQYDNGDFEEIRELLFAYAKRRAEAVFEQIQPEDRDKEFPAVISLQRILEQTGSIHLPFEMARQIQEINRETWFVGEKEQGHHDVRKIRENWAMTYAQLWRKAYKIQLLYVLQRNRVELDTLLNDEIASPSANS
jgi:hypothetical protein